MSRRIAHVVGLFLTAFVLIVQIFLGDTENVPWRKSWWDTMHSFSPRDRGNLAGSPAMVVAIDEETMAETQRWPWPRDMIANLVAALQKQGASALVFDIIMVDPDPLSPLAQARRFAGSKLPDEDLASQLMSRALTQLGDTDEKLARTIAVAAHPQHGENLMPTIMPVAGVPAFDGVDPAIECAFQKPIINLDPPDIELGAGAPSADIPLLLFREAGARLAAIDFAPGTDFVVRRVKAVQNICGAPFLLSGLEGLAAASRGFFTTVKEAGSGLMVHLDVPQNPEKISFPVESDGSFWLHFGKVGALSESGTRRELPRYISAREVLNDGFDSERIKGKIVFVAVIDLGRIDAQLSPLGELIYGVEVQMQMLEQIVSGDFLRRPWFMFAIETALIGLICLLVIALVPQAPPMVSTMMIPLGVLALLFISFGIFKAGVLTDLASPALALVVVGGGVVGGTFIHRVTASEISLQSERADRSYLQGELEAAARIQMALLPPTQFFRDGQVDLACYLGPARTVGGDFYDHFLVDDKHLCFQVADVSGKGADASQFMLLSKTLWKSVALRVGASLEAVQLEANTEITRENSAMMFVTACCGVLNMETGGLHYSAAGHDLPILKRASGSSVVLENQGNIPFGLRENISFSCSETYLQPGDCVCVYTDGVTEAMNEQGEFYGIERLEVALDDAAVGHTSAELVANVVDSVRRFSGSATQSDDLTLMVIRIPVRTVLGQGDSGATSTNS